MQETSREAESDGYLRAHRRYRTAVTILITNLTRNATAVAGFLLDASATGMRIEASLPLLVGDVVRIDFGKVAVIGEVLHYAGVYGRLEVGLKLTKPLNREQLLECLASGHP